MAVDMPSRSAFVSEMVGTHRLRNAISLNASIFHLGGLIGPAISGVLIVAIGSGWSIAVNAVTSAIAVLALALMRSRELMPSPRQTRQAGPDPGGDALHGRQADHPLADGAAGCGGHVRHEPPGAVHGIRHRPTARAPPATACTARSRRSARFIGAMLSSQRRTLRLRAIVAACVVYGVVTMVAGFDVLVPAVPRRHRRHRHRAPAVRGDRRVDDRSSPRTSASGGG